MPELSAPADWITQRSQRIESITRTVATLNHQQAQLRLELNALAQESAGYRKFTGSELALHLAESPQTVDSWITNAEIFCEHPTVVARVADGHWTLRHADALINELLGTTLSATQRQQVAAMVTSRDSARTPYEIRRATRAAVLVIDPDAARARYDKTHNHRTVATFDTTDGATLLASGTKSQIGAMMAGLDALCLVRQPEDDRTLTQRRFDTLMDLICGRQVPGQWTAYVMVDLTVLHDLLNPDPTDRADPTYSASTTDAGTGAGAGVGTGARADARAGVGGEIPGLGPILIT
jgi:hypothetical protein